ncbi:MAG TPA: filament integrity protein fraC [Cyanobacteria bacterium UBA11049]|nr:filament integrity protein fraC [Cyanobacteria bacterium UBA11049]
MRESVLPIPTILFQVLFLLVAIALEARVFHKRLNLTRKISIDYAISINLLCVIIGWLAFFLILRFVPQPLKTQMISFIFFDQLLAPQPGNLNLIIVSTGIVIFFCAFLIKLKGLELLEALLNRPPGQSSSESPDEGRSLSLPARLNRAISHTDANQATVVLLANAYSHSAILLLLFLRFLQVNALG